MPFAVSIPDSPSIVAVWCSISSMLAIVAPSWSTGAAPLSAVWARCLFRSFVVSYLTTGSLAMPTSLSSCSLWTTYVSLSTTTSLLLLWVSVPTKAEATTGVARATVVAAAVVGILPVFFFRFYVVCISGCMVYSILVGVFVRARF